MIYLHIVHSGILKSEEGTDHNLQLLLDCLNIIGHAEFELGKNDDYERTLQLHEFYLKMLALYFDDGFYGIYAFEAMQRHLDLACIYLSCLSDEQKAFEHLKTAVKFVKQYEGLSDPFVYTSTLLNGHKSHEVILKNYTETQSELLINFMNGSKFDSVRDKDWFKSLERELRSAT